MAFDFSKVNLEVIDITTNANPDIYINQTSITFSKRVLEDLNYPATVQYCIDAENRVFAIRICKSNEAKATQFSKPRSDQNTTLSCGNKNMHDIVVKMIPEYDKSKRYKVEGHFDAENKVMYYDMSEAEISLLREKNTEE